MQKTFLYISLLLKYQKDNFFRDKCGEVDLQTLLSFSLFTYGKFTTNHDGVASLWGGNTVT